MLLRYTIGSTSSDAVEHFPLITTYTPIDKYRIKISEFLIYSIWKPNLLIVTSVYFMLVSCLLLKSNHNVVETSQNFLDNWKSTRNILQG